MQHCLSCAHFDSNDFEACHTCVLEKNMYEPRGINHADEFFRFVRIDQIADFLASLSCVPPGTDFFDESIMLNKSDESTRLRKDVWVEWLKMPSAGGGGG